MKFVMVTLDAASRPDLFEYSKVVTSIEGYLPEAATSFHRMQAIRKAMLHAVEFAEVGDVIVQDDTAFTSDPFETELIEGMVTVLNHPLSEDHQCPRAFRFPSLFVRRQIVQAWSDTTEQSCVAWSHLRMHSQVCTTPYRIETSP